MSQGKHSSPPAPYVDLSAVDEIVGRIGRGRENAITILQALQEHYRYLPKEALERVCELTEITPAQLASVSTFYNQFRHEPLGEHVICVCHGTACHVKGAPAVSDAFRRHLGIPEGSDTDSERMFTIQKVACLGCCSLAVAVRIDDVIYGHVTPEKVPGVVADVLQSARRRAERGGQEDRREPTPEGEIRLCLDSCCVARGTGRVLEALQGAVKETGVAARIVRTSCVVVCAETPLVEVALPGRPPVRYANVQPQDVREIVLKHFRPKRLVQKLKVWVRSGLEKILTDESWEPVERYSITMREPRITSFLGPQLHIAMEGYGESDPTDLEAYLRRGGFKVLERCLKELPPEQVIDIVKRSGLRGRGGAGFPTGAKWEAVRGASGRRKFIICNGDEGDPGAFMDRMLLESFPYRVLEGMAIAAHAVGAEEGYLYIRTEYPFAIQRIEEALRRAESRGLLGENVLGTDRRLVFRVRRGAGAFVCGEETALIASIEGRRGTPRVRPPYPAERGLWGAPTLVNNVETYSLVPWILREGPEAFARLGTEKSKGTKVFALAGKTVRGGLVEVPMGITIRQIVEEIGGGIASGRRFKAVLIGGPSGGCIPARLADTPIDYEALTSAGAIMGSGGLIVLDESDCMVDIARYFLEFTQNESCGKCTFCRIGTRRMLDILTRLCNGQGRQNDIEELEHLAGLVRMGSLCGLGKTAPNPVLTTIRYFRDEYEAHLAGRCPAKRCKALIKYFITEDCIGCTRCAQRCPVQAIAFRPYERHEIDPSKCIRCGTCKMVCPSNAVEVK